MTGTPAQAALDERPRLKLCGLRHASQARRCAEAGATHIGCVATPGLPRSAGIDELRAIAEQVGDLAHCVLVFLRPATSEVLRACTETAIYHVQVHGVDETFCGLLEHEGLVVYRVHAIDPARPRLPRPATEPSLLQPALFDCSGADDRGPCVWTRLRATPPPFVFLRGGITLDNVRDVLACRPWGIDVTAAVERAPGDKDERLVARMAALVRAVVPPGPPG